MKRYYFDLRDGDELVPDEEGFDLDSIEVAREEAAHALADLVLHCAGAVHRVAVEVRDANGLILRARFAFDLDERGEQQAPLN